MNQPILTTPLQVSCAFDGGAIEVLSLADPANIQLNIRKDNASEFAQWFYFCLHGTKGQAVTLRWMNAGQSAYPDGWQGYRVVASTDRQHWRRLDTLFDGTVMSCSLPLPADTLWLAYFEPYSHERHLDLVARASASPRVQVRHLGHTVQGRPMTMLRLADAASPVPESARRKLWVIARQHPGETMAHWAAEGLIERLLDPHDALAKALLKDAIVHIVPHMNPDGAVLGNLRTNAVGANLNREWLEPTPERSPEVLCVRQEMLAVGVDFCLDIHGDEGLAYNFCVGSHGTVSFNARRKDLQDRFLTTWAATCPDFQTLRGYPISRPNTGNPTLATNWIAHQFDCLALTLEMPFKDNTDWPDADVGWNGERSRKLGASVLVPLLAVLDSLKK